MKFNLTNFLAAVIKILILVFFVLVFFVFLARRGHSLGGLSWFGLSTLLSMGLVVLFFLRERIDDERVHSLKLKALSVGFALGYPISIWLESALKRDLKNPITAYEFVIITMIISLGFFHFWRWQDGRMNESDQPPGQ